MNIINKFKYNLKKIDKCDVIIFLLTFISFNLVLYILYPGILTYDSYNQLNQIETNSFNDWHPFIHTFIEMICLKINNNPSSIGIFQILVFSVIWTSICKYNRNNKKVFIYELIITILIFLNPLNPIYAITLWKDILYCYFILLLCFITEIIYEKEFIISNKLLVFLSIVLAFVFSLRYNGIIVTIFTVTILAYLLLKKDKISKNYLKLPIITIISILCINSLNLIYNVESNQKDAIASKIVQYIGAFVKEEVISNKDNQVLSNFINVDELYLYYNPYFSDTIYECDFEEDIYLNYKKEIYGMLLKYTFKYPQIFFDFASKSTSLIWQIPSPDDMIGTTIETGTDATNNYMGIVPKHYDEEFYQEYQKFLNYTKNSIFLSTILYNTALYFYLTIIIILIILFVKKKNYFIVLLPSLLNVLSTVPSLPVQDTRYLYNNFLVFYLILVILIRNFIKDKN